MEKLQYFERIEAYMDGQMSVTEGLQFETELEVNAELKEEYDAFLATTVALEWMVIEDLSNERKDISKNNLTLTRNRKPWLTIAASLLFLLFLGVGSFANFNFSNKVIVQEFYKSPNWTNIIRGNENDISKVEINQLLGNEDYEKLISYLEKIEEGNTDYTYLLANAYFKNNQEEKAIIAFQKVVSSTDNDAKASAEWYLVLSYLQNGENEKAKNQIKIIIQKNNHPNKQKALKLEEKLNSFWRRLVF